MPETNLHVAGLILARGGSLGIPLKNLAPLGSRPLLQWSLSAMVKYGGFDSLWVSTDHPAIANCASAFPGVNVFARSPHLARSDTPSVAAVQEFMSRHPEVDVVGLVQCTSPFLRPEYLDKAHRLVLAGYDSVFSVTRDKKFRWSEATFGGEVVSNTRPLNFDPAQRPRRQDWLGDLVENGMFYFARRHLVEDGVLQGGAQCTYVEVPKELSIEIDSTLDLAFAEQILLHEGLEPLPSKLENSLAI